MAELEKLRPCGRFELFSTARHHLGYFNNIACAATYHGPASHSSLKDTIYRALHAVITRHAMLSAVLVNEDKPYSDVHFARLPSINLDSCVEFVQRKSIPDNGEEDEALERFLEDKHSTGFKEARLGSRPFWHLLVLSSPGDASTFTAVWFFHHALGDGGCGPIFHRALLSALQDVSAQPAALEPVHGIVPSPSTPLLPPFELLHPQPLSWLFFIRAILGSIFPSVFAPRAPKLWTGPRAAAPIPLPRTRVQLLTLSASTTAKLLKLSRENKTTVQATLECSVAASLLATLPSDRYDKVRASGPISMRSLLRNDGKPVADDDFVLALSQYTHLHTRASDMPGAFSWSEARAVRSSIRDEVAKQGADNVVSLLRYVSDMHSYFTDKIGQERDTSFELSNLGVVKTGDGSEGGWKLGRCVFSQTPNVTGPPIACSVVTGGDGCCVLAFSWLDGVVEEEMVRAVVQGVKTQVEKLAGESG